MASSSETIEQGGSIWRASGGRGLEVLDCLSGAFMALDAFYRLTYLNQSAEQLFGVVRQRVLGTVFWTLFPAARGAAAELELERAMTERVVRRFELVHPPSRRWFEINACPADDGGLVIDLRDISSAKRSEAVLDGQRRALELAVNGASLDSILEVLVSTIEDQAHGALASILLLDPDGLHLRHGVAPRLAPAYCRALDGTRIGPDVGSCGTAAHSGRPVIAVDIATDPRWTGFRDQALEQGLRACWSVPIFSGRGQVLGTFAVYHREPHSPSASDQDVVELISRTAGIVIERQRETERRLAAEKRLETADRRYLESEEKFRNLADSMSQLAWMADETGYVFWYNRRWFEYTGATLEEMLGWGWTKVAHPDHLAGVVERMQRSWEAGVPWEDTFPMRNRHGEYRWFLSRALPIRDEAGRLLYWFGTDTDITEQRQAEAAFKQAKEAAERANRSKDEFLAMLGHELRNPLAPIVTALKLMDSRPGAMDPQARAVIDRQMKHLTRLVDDLLDISRITRAKVELKRNIVEMGDVITRSIEMASPLLEERLHRLTVEIPPGLRVDGDMTRLSQVVANLLTNAAKYTEPGGAITVQASLADGMVRVTVKDTGIGIPPTVLPKVFDLFVQADQAMDRARGGLGIGLAIVRGLVQAHGGTVSAHSDGPGKGSQFTVALPCVSEEAALDHRPRRLKPRRAARGLRVLVVDDNADASEMLAELLSTLGHVVHAEIDGLSALRAASEFKPDVALLDIGLPVLDGYQLARRLREVHPAGSLLLVAVTGYGQESDRRRSRQAGFDAHFVKPIDVEALEGLLSAYALDWRQASASASAPDDAPSRTSTSTSTSTSGRSGA